MIKKNLTLIRHATAVDSLRFENDWQRPLTEEGVFEAQNLGRILSYLVAEPPDVVFYSPAKRAKQTMAGLLSILPFDFSQVDLIEDPIFMPDGDPHASLQRLSREFLQEETKNIWLVGHNPQLAKMLRLLLGEQQIVSSLFERSSSFGLKLAFDPAGMIISGRTEINYFIPTPLTKASMELFSSFGGNS